MCHARFPDLPRSPGAAAGAYVAKGSDWTPAEEITRGDLKTGRAGSRTPFQILADYCQTGDRDDRELWREYTEVTRGLAAVRWSRDLRAHILGPTAEPELPDEQLSRDVVDGDSVVLLSLTTWSRLRLAGLEHAAPIAAERDGGPAVAARVGAKLVNPPTHLQFPLPRPWPSHWTAVPNPAVAVHTTSHPGYRHPQARSFSSRSCRPDEALGQCRVSTQCPGRSWWCSGHTGGHEQGPARRRGQSVRPARVKRHLFPGWPLCLFTASRWRKR